MNTILGPIDDVVAWIITNIYHLLSPVFGATGGVTWVLTIVLLTMLMRLLLVPLFIKQMHTQRAMTALTPQLTEFRKKYKGDRERLNAETMKLYQEAGVNPMMGCLPLLLQMPIFFALFSVLRYIAEWKSKETPPSYHLSPVVIKSAQNAQIFGVSIKDTFLHGQSVHVHVVVAFVVAISMLTTYLTMRQNVKRGIMPTGKDNPMGQSQRMMTYILPLFALTGLYWPFGLVMYWVTTNVWTLGQQFVLLRKYPVGAALPTGGLPLKGSSGRPATASGFTGSTSGKPKPVGTGGATGASRPKPKQADAVSDAAASKPKVTDKAGGSGAASKPKVTDKAGGSGAASKPKVTDKAGGSGAASKPKVTDKAGGSGAADARPGTGAAADANGQVSQRSSTPDRQVKPAGAGKGSTGSAASGSANGHKSAGDGGVLRRIGRGRTEPEAQVPAEPEPEVKVVRQQRQRQSRSKRSGKR